MSAVRLLMLVVLSASAWVVAGEERPYVHQLFNDHMVFPRDLEAPVWGWCEPGKEVTVAMAGKSAKATAGADGRWQVKLGPFAAGGPHELVISGPKEQKIGDVLVGDVWICSGQSNMEWGVHSSNNSHEEIAKANHPKIRLFYVPKRISTEPQSLVSADWKVCSPESVPGFSAVGYFFGRLLHEQTGIPIGLINSNWGGTVAEAWTSAGALKTMDDFKGAVEDFERTAKNGQDDFEQIMAEWWKKNDPGSLAGLGFADPNVEVNDWKSMNLPGHWEGQGLPNFDGIVWFRRDFELPENWTGKDVKLHLGAIDDRDTTWVNGSKVGEMNDWNHDRVYKVPKKLLKTGRNTIAVRVLDTGGGGGFHGRPEQLQLERAGGDPIALAGEWRWNMTKPFSEVTQPPSRIDNNPNAVTVLSNGMISCLEPFAIKGAIWYQGESNAGRADQYRRLLPTMIKDWRQRFGVGDFPFYIVQLANFMEPTNDPVQSGWAELREAQLWTAMNVPNCGIAVTIDIGDAKDIHPRNKQDVGKRLALEALAKTYGKQLVHQGPLYKEMKIEGNTVRLVFDHVGGGLEQRGDKLAGFAIAGADGKFVHGEARIDGANVIVTGAGIEQPTAVRYGWANNPPATLFNKDGLPASPFRTDAPK
ncbi:MAG: beta galactosidase jelly roll domain-containing protein [Planctomycetes bacterium]|nr:beta galactosidase jelly roll domain-containing protein [Planctomycetota bacterium]